MKKILTTVLIVTLLAACNGNRNDFDASGTFEADEVIVSASSNGKILSLSIDEGSVLSKDSIVGLVDPADIDFQKQQVEQSIQALNEQTINVQPQIKLLRDQLNVQQSKLDNLLHEKQRTQNLVKADAATGKQLDDINAQIDMLSKEMEVTRQQINVQLNNSGTQNRSILSQGKPLEKKVAQLEDQLAKTSIKNPINGTVLVKYAEPGEMTSSGKPLYKIADLSTVLLRAYISGSQLSQVKLGQTVKVLVDDGKDKYKEHSGIISWISDKAEFTPKTIQTKDERASLVYAMKIKVKNDGYLKIGMYGEVKFQ
jgi:HlyD family secretion protein